MAWWRKKKKLEKEKPEKEKPYCCKRCSGEEPWPGEMKDE